LGKLNWAIRASRAWHLLKNNQLANDRKRYSLINVLKQAEKFDLPPFQNIEDKNWIKMIKKFKNHTNKELKKNLRKERANQYKEQKELIDKEGSKNSSLFRKLIFKQSDNQPPPILLAHEEEVFKPDEVINLTAEYFENLYHHEPSSSLHPPWSDLEIWDLYRDKIRQYREVNGELTKEISMEELVFSLKNLKGNSSPGPELLCLTYAMVT